MLPVTTFSICSSLTIKFLNMWVHKGLFSSAAFFFFPQKIFSFVVWKETVKISGICLIQCSFIESSDRLRELDFQITYMICAYGC